MGGNRYCPLQRDAVPCTPRCAWYDEASHCCDISRIAAGLDDIAGWLEEITPAYCREGKKDGLCRS